MSKESIKQIALEAFPPRMFPTPSNMSVMIDANLTRRDQLIKALERMEENGIELVIREGGRNNSLSKEILEESKSVGELEATCKSEVCVLRGKGVCKFKAGEYCPMHVE